MFRERPIQFAAVLANLDGGNQYMNHFLTDDIVASPNLALTDDALPVLAGPGLGFELNMDAVNRAAEAHRQAFGFG
jgi:muconate cycloisomerase